MGKRPLPQPITNPFNTFFQEPVGNTPYKNFGQPSEKISQPDFFLRVEPIYFFRTAHPSEDFVQPSEKI